MYFDIIYFKIHFHNYTITFFKLKFGISKKNSVLYINLTAMLKFNYNSNKFPILYHSIVKEVFLYLNILGYLLNYCFSKCCIKIFVTLQL